jgi:hypothetical protein
MELTMRDDHDEPTKDPLKFIEANRKVLIRSIKDPIHDYSTSRALLPLSLTVMAYLL